ncbi:replication initiation protein [Butyrivibrio sp. MC2013]|uniref:replication initiation protein n=1 Tax=Butyrivibrio sp. MC2013 TaxID=1280686 RepID=UPI00040A77A6|nr:replication initiation protein [Butyrivibrio sp. MC2013]
MKKDNIENAKEVAKLIPNDDYSKSNFLISAKYNSSLLENKLLAISFADLDNLHQESNGVLVSEIPANTIRKLLGSKSGSFYDQLDAAAQGMTSRSIGAKDPSKNKFDYYSFIIRASYEDSKLRIYYNPYMKDYIVNLKSKFTRLSLTTMLSFKSVYSFRLYELLKSEVYKSKHISYSIAELKLELGVVNAELDVVQRFLKGSESPDYEKAVEKSPEKHYESWRDFKKYVIEVAVNEINQSPMTGITVSYDTVKRGRGGKVHQIIFTVVDREGTVEKSSPTLTGLTEDEKMDRMFEIRDILSGANLNAKDIRAIAEAAAYDVDRVAKAWDIASLQGGIDNTVGWMIDAIKKDYDRPKSSGTRTSKKDSFMENQYDFESIEKEFLAN